MAQPGQTYTPNTGALQGRINQLTQQVSSGFKGMPQVRQDMGNQLLDTEGSLPVMAQDRGAMLEKLFNADQAMSSRFANPESPDFIENPMARNTGTEQYTNTLWGSLGALNTTISARKQILGDTITRGMEVYKAGLEAQQIELDNMYKQMEIAQAQEARAADTQFRKEQFAADQEYRKQQLDIEKAKLYTSTTSKPMTADASDMFQAIGLMDNYLNQFNDALNDMNGGYGPYSGAVKGALYSTLKNNPAINKLETVRQSAAPIFNRVQNPGVPGGSQQAVSLINEIKNKALPAYDENPQENWDREQAMMRTMYQNALSLYQMYGVRHPILDNSLYQQISGYGSTTGGATTIPSTPSTLQERIMTSPGKVGTTMQQYPSPDQNYDYFLGD